MESPRGFRRERAKRSRDDGGGGSLHRRWSTGVRSIAFAWILAALVAAGWGTTVAADEDDDEDRAEFGDWSTPVNLGPVVNSPVNDLGSAVSRDGLSLFFSRPGGLIPNDIWVSQRSSRRDPWGPPLPLTPINTLANEAIPALSRDDHWMFFNSNRTGGFGMDDLWASYRKNVHNDFGWQTPVNLGAGVNSAFLDQGAGYFEHGACDDDGKDDDEDEGDNERGGGARRRDGEDREDDCTVLLYFNSNRPGGLGLIDIYVSERMPDGSFGPAELVKELSSPLRDQRPHVRFDGLELFLWSNRLVSADTDIWVSTRRAVTDPWTTPVNLGPTLNSPQLEAQAYLSADGRTLYFSSTRPGGSGNYDIYVTTRARDWDCGHEDGEDDDGSSAECEDDEEWDGGNRVRDDNRRDNSAEDESFNGRGGRPGRAGLRIHGDSDI